MNNTIRPKAEQLELEAAAQWWANLRGPHSEQTAKEWLAWSEADARHAEAFEGVAELGAQLGALDAQSKADLLAEFASPEAEVPRRRIPYAAAAAVALTALIGGFLAWLLLPTRQEFASQIGENRDIVLSDGSRLALGGESSVNTRFSALRRDVELRSGEAYFEVAHNAQRPFTVEAGELSVRAVGTAFDVRRDHGRVTVAVAEGRVRITGLGNAPGKSRFAVIEASAGQRVIYDPHVAGLTVSRIDPAHAAAWRERRLEFVDEPLTLVIERINRYSRRPLRLADEQLGTLVFTGSIRLDDMENWLRALPAIFPLEVRTESDHITLSRAGPVPQHGK